LRGFKSVSLQWELGLWLAGGLILLFIPLVLLGAHEAAVSAAGMAAERLLVAQMTAVFLDTELEEQFVVLEYAARGLGESADRSPEQRLLIDYSRARNAFISSFFLTDAIGRVQWTTASDPAVPGDDLSTADYVRQPLMTGSRYVSPVHTHQLTGSPTAILAVPVRAPNGQIVGTLAGRLNASAAGLQTVAQAAELVGENGHAELVDQNLRLIVGREYGHPGRALNPADHSAFYHALLAQSASAVALTDPIEESGQRHVMAFAPLTSAPWGFGLGGSESIWVGVLALATALFFAWVTRRTVVVPVESLIATTGRIAAGDLTTPIRRLGGGEVRLLAGALDDMRQSLWQAREALALERSRYRAIVESMADAVVTTDASGRITAFNPATEALTGWPADEVLGQPYGEIVRLAGGSESGGRASGRLLAISDRSTIGIVKGWLTRRDGRQTAVAVARSPIHGQDGATKGTVHVLRDVSADEELSRLKDEFLSAVSHELRTPLGAIKGYATTILLEPADYGLGAATERCLRIIVEASDELEELVGNLLDMSKIGADAFAIEPATLRLRPLVSRAVDRLRARASQHRVTLLVPPRLPSVWADPHRVEQVLYNLLDNAIKYTPDGGAIEIVAAASDAEVTVSVTDDGLGIPPEELDRLFDRFQRGASARMRQIKGTGLGLAICRGIVEAHGGRIWAESPVHPEAAAGSPGTAMRFTLPLARVVTNGHQPDSSSAGRARAAVTALEGEP
jgi:PAS domain S-box-containing protein